MNIRPTRPEDFPVLLDIYARARRFMAASGNPNQWGNTRPSPEQIRQDIAQGVSYVLEDEDGIQGVLALIFGPDPTYRVIENGRWLDEGPYATIHRMASAGKKKGIAAALFRWAFAQSPSIRVDTHEQNAVMRRCIEKAGFRYCGVIHIADGSPRLAYQRVLSPSEKSVKQRSFPMKTVTVRGVEIGAGIPKICAPLVGKTEAEILSAAAKFPALPVDVAEWRCDWFEGVQDPERLSALLPQLRAALGNIPLLLTYRSQAEGGEGPLSGETYASLLLQALEAGPVDLLDVELSAGEKLFRLLIEAAHRKGVFVIGSSHDFQRTPRDEVLLTKLEMMALLGADIAKIAVMPQSPEDVARLLSVTARRSAVSPIPLITMSMSAMGLVSRLAGETFGSALTFGSVGTASAPGQIPVEELKQTLELLHGKA